MIIPDFKPLERVEVVWLDAVSEPEWGKIEDATQKPHTKSITRGFYLGQDDQFIYTAPTLGIDGNNECSRDIIPLGCVISVKRQ